MCSGDPASTPWIASRIAAGGTARSEWTAKPICATPVLRRIAARVSLRKPAHGALKRVAMHIRHARQHQAVEHNLVLVRAAARDDRDDLMILHVNLNVARDASRQQRIVGAIDLH